ncbi:MAG: hypothetical protein HYY37_05590 [Candidatus Aenigmarchaeota archaeon]|nr:hypothetical protein [Candidatus Aenigmarchaeota archaeon]
MTTIGILYNDVDGIFLKRPFSAPYSLAAYRKFSEIAAERGFKVAVAKPGWYAGNKLALSWNLLTERVERSVPVDFIFDRCLSFSDAHRTFMRRLRNSLNRTLPLVNHPFIEGACTDKRRTHALFSRFMPATCLRYRDLRAIRSPTVVVKPRFGFGGRGVRVVSKERLRSLPRGALAQEFIDTSAGMRGMYHGVHDLRVVMLDGRVADFYLRVPRHGFISNISRGGSAVRIPRLPYRVRKICSEVDKRFAACKPRLYSIDFLLDRHQVPWIAELNAHVTLVSYYEFEGMKPVYDELCRRLLGSIQSVLEN